MSKPQVCSPMAVDPSSIISPHNTSLIWAVRSGTTALALLLFLTHAATSKAAELPAGTNLEVRLSAPTGSRISHPGDPIQAIVIAPFLDVGRPVVPQGAILSGFVGTVHRLGFGLKQTTASIEFRFTSLRLPNQDPVAISSRVMDVETAKERVNSRGVIGGIHPVANLSSGVSIFISALLMQPGIAVPVLAVKFLIARSPDPEISFPAGTEVVIQVNKAVQLPTLYDTRPLPALSVLDGRNARHLLNTLPQQQTMIGPRLPSDLSNLLILGRHEQIDRAFRAAGWTGSHGHNAVALYRIFHCMVQRAGYSMAPMANLTLNGRVPEATYQKSLDTFAKRHHIRLWRQDDSDAWLSAASEDLSFTVKRMHVTHYSDLAIDNERAKVVNDLALTGCVAAASILARDHLRFDAEEKGPILTDGRIAVVRLNDCSHPSNVVPPPELHLVPSRLSHATVAIAKDFVRSNPLSLGYSATKMIFGRSGRESAGTTLAKAASGSKTEVAEADLFSKWRRQTVTTLPTALAGYSSSGR